MPFDPSTDLEKIPQSPGVYIMKGEGDKIIYVGKALHLRNRLRQYFGASSDNRYFVPFLGQYLKDLEVVITANEKEALILENELIKKHQPPFNVMLKDDKNFLHLRIDEASLWPRIEVVRKPKKDGARYFGPYHVASHVRETLKTVERAFQIRSCDDQTLKNRSRPCLQYQIKRCLGPCCLQVDAREYAEHVRETILFLQGKYQELLKQIQIEMEQAAEDLQFERAAILRDRMIAIKNVMEPQTLIQFNSIDRDVIGLYRLEDRIQITLVEIRNGRTEGIRHYAYKDAVAPDEELLSSFLNQLYSGGAVIPNEILLRQELEDAEALEERLTELKGRKVKILCPKRGQNVKLLEMAERNAVQAFNQEEETDKTREKGLKWLKQKLRLKNLPRRIECYDISLFQGANPVASQVVFKDGYPSKKDYRHFKIQTIEGTNDFGMMRETLMRRLQHEDEERPDLIVVDGGKGQLSKALEVFKELNVSDIDVCGLAKSRNIGEDHKGDMMRSPERVFLPNIKDPIPLQLHTDAYHILTEIRDEAHRFAITFHRKLRNQSTLTSELDRIPGVGPKLRQALLQRFGSIKAIRQASIDELCEIDHLHPALAERILEALNGDGGE